MIGLLKKDIFLLKAQKNFFLLIIAITFFIGYNANNSFAVFYLTFLCSFQMLNSFSYDDNGGCTSFLLTLPVSRSGYVREKYVFGLLLTSAGWIIGELINVSMALMRGNMPQMAEIGQNLAWLMGFWIFIFVTIPVVIKYGVERGRIVIFFIFAVFAGILFFGEKGVGTDQCERGRGAGAAVCRLAAAAAHLYGCGNAFCAGSFLWDIHTDHEAKGVLTE